MTRRGFTLIELLAAVFISSIVVSASFILMTSTTNSFNDEDERRTLKSNLRIAELLIQRDMARTAYMTPFDTRNSKDSELLWNIVTSNPEIIAFRYHPHEEFSAFTITASLSDFLEFQIERVNGQQTLCIRPQLTMPLTAADIGNLGTDANPVAQNADAATFRAAFSRTFSGVTSIAIQNPTGKYVVTETEEIKSPASSATGDCIFQIKLKKVSGTAPSSVEGFEGSNFLEGCNVFPVVAISYVVAPDIQDAAQNNLLRCVNNPLNPETEPDEIANLSTCEILIHNIRYFEVFPLLTSSTSNAYFNALTSDENGIKNPYGEEKQHTLWNGLNLSQLRGVYFRFGATTPNPANIRDNAQGDVPFSAFTRINGILYPFEHLQGIAAFKNINMHVSTVSTL